MTHIIDGRSMASKILGKLKHQVLHLKIKPCFAIILVGENPESKIYVSGKIKAAAEIGIKADLYKFEDSVSEIKLLKKIKELNLAKDVNGIIVQMPLPAHINSAEIIHAMDPKKDIDGFHPINVGMLYSGLKPYFIPCTPLGILDILKTQFDSLKGLYAVIIGRSNIVGRPLASLLLKNDMTVTICHSKTKNLPSITKQADVVICASGQTESLGKEYFSEKTIVIDVGINRMPNGKIAGDVKFYEVHDYVRAITPVPGGVGPMTIANLMKAITSIVTK